MGDLSAEMLYTCHGLQKDCSVSAQRPRAIRRPRTGVCRARGGWAEWKVKVTVSTRADDAVCSSGTGHLWVEGKNIAFAVSGAEFCLL